MREGKKKLEKNENQMKEKKSIYLHWDRKKWRQKKDIDWISRDNKHKMQR